MSFTGSPKAYRYLGATIQESDTAVAVIPVGEARAAGWHTLAGQTRQVSATLARPLGNPVLLDEHGAPVMVTSMKAGLPTTRRGLVPRVPGALPAAG